MDLNDIIGKEESEVLEFKSSLAEWKEIVKTVSAFSNTRGGWIVIGVEDNGEIIGIKSGKGTIEDITNKILQSTEPRVYPEISSLKIDGKEIIAIKVEKFPYDVVLAFGRPYVRVGKSTVKMGKDEYKRRVLSIHIKDIQFEGLPIPEASLDDIDKEKLKRFLKKARDKRDIGIDETEPPEAILKKLKLMKAGEITNAGMLLFGKDPQNYIEHAKIKCTHFKGVDVTGEIIDFKEISGDIISQIESAEKFIFSNISLKAWIEDGKIERQEKWEYPPKAIREALVNAIVHRDYRIPAKAQIRIFDDRIEFWNPGRLPEGWNIETLLSEHISEPFNPVIARAFFWIGYVEEIGTGINKIIKWCREWGLPEPEFMLKSNNFVVILRKTRITEEYIRSLPLSKRDKEIIEILRDNGIITSSDIQKKYDVSRDTANRWLKRLLDFGIIERKGRGKSTYYTLKGS